MEDALKSLNTAVKTLLELEPEKAPLDVVSALARIKRYLTELTPEVIPWNCNELSHLSLAWLRRLCVRAEPVGKHSRYWHVARF
ncbi:hypothetical protein WJX72_004132 [[Myrmecia] bisecta]|uniref:Uncharacterized protein n=1 Tax=[Myrmecia] bisecta TaxID=41462 RepID=A0AAW1PWG4_9CHLO